MKYKSFVFNPIQENTYIVYDETNEAVIVDAGNFCDEENSKLACFISENNLKIKLILNTHNHWDHIFGLSWVKKTYNVPIYCHANDLPWIDNFEMICQSYGFGKRETVYPDFFFNNGDVVRFGNTELQVIHTPGHSQGGVSLYCKKDNLILTGDTLFFSSIGRADLPGGDEFQLINSIKSKLFILPDETTVLPGHGISTTIGYEKTNNPYLQ